MGIRLIFNLLCFFRLGLPGINHICKLLRQAFRRLDLFFRQLDFFLRQLDLLLRQLLPHGFRNFLTGHHLCIFHLTCRIRFPVVRCRLLDKILRNGYGKIILFFLHSAGKEIGWNRSGIRFRSCLRLSAFFCGCTAKHTVFYAVTDLFSASDAIHDGILPVWIIAVSVSTIISHI